MNTLHLAARIVQVGLLALVLAVGVSACVFGSDAGSVGSLIHIHDGWVSIRGRNDTTARIKADGDLRIASKAVALTPAQRALTTQYVEQVKATLRDGIATGKAGAAMAASVIGTVFSGLARGDTRDIDRKANAQAAKIKGRVARICDDMQAIQATQNQLAAQLSAFAPYTVIDDQRVGECRSGLHDH